LGEGPSVFIRRWPKHLVSRLMRRWVAH